MALRTICNKCGNWFVQADVYGSDWPEDLPKCPHCRKIREKAKEKMEYIVRQYVTNEEENKISIHLHCFCQHRPLPYPPVSICCICKEEVQDLDMSRLSLCYKYKKKIQPNRLAVLQVDFNFLSMFQRDPMNSIVNLLEGIPEGAILYKVIWDPNENLGLVFSHESFEEISDGKRLQRIKLKSTGKHPWKLEPEEKHCNHCFCKTINQGDLGKVLHVSTCCKCGRNAEIHVEGGDHA